MHRSAMLVDVDERRIASVDGLFAVDYKLGDLVAFRGHDVYHSVLHGLAEEEGKAAAATERELLLDGRPVRQGEDRGQAAQEEDAPESA